MRGIIRPTYNIRDIADVDPATLIEQGVSGIVFPHAPGILTAYENRERVAERQALQKLGSQGVKFYLLTQDKSEWDVLQRWHNRVDYEEVVDMSTITEKSSIRAGLERLLADRAELLVVGNWLYTDIRQANEAGFRTALMAEQNGPRGVHMLLKHPVETMLRAASGLPVRRKDFPTKLTKVGAAPETADTIDT